MTAPELLKEQMPLVRQIESNLRGYGYTKGTPEWRSAFDTELTYYRRFGFAGSQWAALKEKRK